MQQEISVKRLREFDPLALNTVSRDQSFYHISKRIIDFFIAIFVLLIFSPFMAIIAIMIKLDSPGPIIFSQERVTVKRRKCNHNTYWQKVTFRCYKFRTMVCNADPSLHKSYITALINNDSEEMAALQGENTKIRKLTRDPRVTRVGKILRKLSLDEIPQFFNVIKGDMSLVGPRPAIPYEVELYKPWHYKRLEAKPGITGLWQVTARSTADFDKIVEIDIQYINHQSIWLDLMIMLKTPLAVFSGKGAV